jgi:hypothetical protein
MHTRHSIDSAAIALAAVHSGDPSGPHDNIRGCTMRGASPAGPLRVSVSPSLILIHPHVPRPVIHVPPAGGHIDDQHIQRRARAPIIGFCSCGAVVVRAARQMHVWGLGIKAGSDQITSLAEPMKEGWCGLWSS